MRKGRQDIRGTHCHKRGPGLDQNEPGVFPKHYGQWGVTERLEQRRDRITVLIKKEMQRGGEMAGRETPSRPAV